MMYVIDLRVIPLFLLWILCLFVASKTLTRKQTPERSRTGHKNTQDSQKYGQDETTLLVTDISSTWVAGEARAK